MNVPELDLLLDDLILKAQKGLLKSEDLDDLAAKAVDMFNEKYQEFMFQNFFKLLKVGCKPIITANLLTGGDDLSGWQINVKIGNVESQLFKE